MSTIPPFQGGLEPMARRRTRSEGKAPDRPRESMDPDDFRGGFAVWSGTSFSAPIVAGGSPGRCSDAGPAASGRRRAGRDQEREGRGGGLPPP